MSEKGGSKNNLSEYCKNSAMLIRKTLTKIDKGGCSKIGHIELELIAEFASVFCIKDWAAKHRWVISDKFVLRKWDIVCEDLIAIAEAQKAGALFELISLQCTDYALIKFNKKLYKNDYQAELPSLRLINEHDDDPGARLVVEALELGLSLNSFRSKALKSLIEAIAAGAKVKWLDFAFQHLHNEIFTLICNALQAGAKVQFLDLTSCRISNDGAKLIAEALVAGAQLIKLDLSSNRIGDEGAISLANAIRCGVELESLNLWKNPISGEGDAALETAAKLTGVSIEMHRNLFFFKSL